MASRSTLPKASRYCAAIGARIFCALANMGIAAGDENELQIERQLVAFAALRPPEEIHERRRIEAAAESIGEIGVVRGARAFEEQRREGKRGRAMQRY